MKSLFEGNNEFLIYLSAAFWPLLILIGYLLFMTKRDWRNYLGQFSRIGTDSNKSMLRNFSFVVTFFVLTIFSYILLVYVFERFGVISSYIMVAMTLFVFCCAWRVEIRGNLIPSILAIILFSGFIFALPLYTESYVTVCFSSALFLSTGVLYILQKFGKSIVQVWLTRLTHYSFPAFLVHNVRNAMRINDHKFRKTYFFYQALTIAIIIFLFVFYERIEFLLPNSILEGLESYKEIKIERKYIPYVTLFVYLIFSKLRFLEVMGEDIKWFSNHNLNTAMKFFLSIALAYPLALLSIVIFAAVLGIGHGIFKDEFAIILAFFIFAQWIPGIHAFFISIFKDMEPSN